MAGKTSGNLREQQGGNALLHPLLVYTKVMKKSTLFFICCMAVLISLGWLFDHPVRIIMLVLAAIAATLALISALKRKEEKQDGSEKED